MGAGIALAASARDWPDRLHRFLLDHGGARVQARVMGAEQALAADYELILLDDISSFLTPRLVRRLREQGKEVVGVFSPDDGPDAKRRLLECGITDVVESEAGAEEFLAVIGSTLEHRRLTHPVEPPTGPMGRGFRVGVRSAATGSGCTEVAVAVAAHLGRSLPVVVVDLDQAHPGLAQRLDLPQHPNLRTAVDLAHHDHDRLIEAVIDAGEVGVVGGLAIPSPDEPLQSGELVGLLEDLAELRPVQILDMGESANGRAIKCDIDVLIAEATPVGLTRLMSAVGSSPDLDADRIVVVNKAPRGRRHDDIRFELARSMPRLPMTLLPNDGHVERAAWDGVIVTRGGFARSVGRIAGLIANAITRS